MANQVAIMVLAIVLAVAFMIFASGSVSAFVDRHPTVKMLALSFLLLIGVTLIAGGIGQHLSKAYVYFAMAFAVFVEMLNLRGRRLREAH
jgi:predicted tellurium resistance membrane protein TerC